MMNTVESSTVTGYYYNTPITTPTFTYTPTYTWTAPEPTYKIRKVQNGWILTHFSIDYVAENLKGLISIIEKIENE